MSSSCKPVINHQYSKKDGRSAVYLRVIIDGKKKDINLEISWPAKKFHPTKYCEPLSKDDKLAADNNLLIGKALNKANEIFLYFRLRDVKLTL